MATKNQFYALATTDTKGTSSRIVRFDEMGSTVPTTLFHAEKIAAEYCKKNGLVFQSAHKIQSEQKQGSTMTKFKKLRQKTGSNGRHYAKSL